MKADLEEWLKEPYVESMEEKAERCIIDQWADVLARCDLSWRPHYRRAMLVVLKKHGYM